MTLRRFAGLAIFLGAGLWLPSPARAGPQVPAPQDRLTPGERAAALKTIEAKFEELYVFPELRPKIIDRLEGAARAGRYDVDDPSLFADRITTDLRDVAHDEHLSLSVDPAAYAAALAPPESDAGEEAFLRRRAIRDHHGLGEMRILPGNVRYLRISHFEWIQDETGAAYDDAMRFLKNGDAWILDLRGNPGGTAAAAHYLVSHFFEPGTVDYLSYAGSSPATTSPALDYLPAGRLIGKPLYLLVDGNVGSAAEAVAYDLQQFKLAEVVGAKTAGAANNNKLLPVGPKFILSISYGRPVHVISHANWEGVGVIPSVECAPLAALDTAHALALHRLAQSPNLTPEQQRDYAWAAPPVDARLHPVTLAAAQLERLAGRYGKPDVGFGEMSVRLDGGALWLMRPKRPIVRLLPLTSGGLFAIEGNELLRVHFAAHALELLWWEAPDSPRVFERD